MSQNYEHGDISAMIDIYLFSIKQSKTMYDKIIKKNFAIICIQYI